MTGETRARQRIREAVETRGCRVLNIEWEPWGQAAEKEGIPGGWTVLTDAPLKPNTNYGDEVCGLSVEEVLADIDWTLRPTEPCVCYPNDRDRHPLVSIVGDPEHPLHEPTCRWYIAYQLRWWSPR